MYNYLACNAKSKQETKQRNTAVKEGEKERNADKVCAKYFAECYATPQFLSLEEFLRNELHENHQNKCVVTVESKPEALIEHLGKGPRQPCEHR